MEIREIAINHYGPLRDIRYSPQPGLQVFHGPNESGKTLLLDSILKLMLGNRLRDFSDIDRVPDPPQGRIAMRIEGREHILDGSTRLDQLTKLDSSYLRNIFVIRNKDLNIAGQSGFLRRVNDQLTGMESQRLSDLKDILRRQGRLTNPTASARLSKSAEFSKIGEHVETAEALAEEIQAYLSTAKDQQLDSIERRLEETRGNLRNLMAEIRGQELAEKYQAYLDLVQMVDEYEERAEVAGRLQPYTQRTLITLQELESRAAINRDTAEANQNKLAQLTPRLEKAHAMHTAAKAKVAPLVDRMPQLENLEQRTLLAAGTSAPQPVPLAKFIIPMLIVTVLGLIIAGLAQPFSTLLAAIPALSLFSAAALFMLDRWLSNKVREHEQRNRLLLQEGAASGIMALTLQELAATLAQQKIGLQQDRSTLQTLSDDVRGMRQQQENFLDNIHVASANADKAEHQLRQQLRQLGVTSLEEFGTKMAEYNQAQTQCDELHQRLEEEFGQLPPHTGGWRQLLLQRPVPAAAATTYDRNHLVQLRSLRDSTQEQVDKVREQLQQHKTTLAGFASACQGLPLDEEGIGALPPDIVNLEMLEHAGTVLEEFATAVRTRFSTAKHLLEVLDELEREEQAKMVDLVGTNKPVQEIFRTVTGGRYTAISLDEDLNIQVQNSSGLTLPASALSQGTYDQLYLALRLSLAKDLLAGEPGFLLLDDAFLCADSQRLDRLLAVLAEEAAQGWQIIYFTMDERLVEAARRHTSTPPVLLNQLQS